MDKRLLIQKIALFVKGMNPDSSQDGIYFHQPSSNEIDGYEQKLAALVRRRPHVQRQGTP